MLKIFHKLTEVLITAQSRNKDKARREFILNILLVGTITLAVFGFIKILYNYFFSADFQGIHPLIFFFILAFFCFDLFLSRIGKITASAAVFIIALGLANFMTSLQWGADLPQVLLMYSLLIVMSGILISTRFAFFATLIIGASIIGLSIFQTSQIYQPSQSWRLQPIQVSDSVVYVITLLIVATVSWLFNREMERALKRARSSELALTKQNDQLEIMVTERTKQLELAQIEKLTQIYRFAEFGKSASGLFHDLVGPLTLTSLNLTSLSKQIKQPELVDAKYALKKAILGTKRLENFIAAARKQIQNQKIIEKFSIKTEVKQAIQMFEHRARKNKINIVFKPTIDFKLFGNPIKFTQLTTNLLSNAIDSYENIKKEQKIIEIRLNNFKKRILLEIQDWGVGIDKENLSKIFDPLFTTKSFERGTGIGLSICKDIVEKDFKGKINVESEAGIGTIFKINIPLPKHNLT